jgi:hypothetical protein
MENPKPPPTQEEVALQLSHDLMGLRDALLRLSLAMGDWVFEASLTEDTPALQQVNSLIEKLKSQGGLQHRE